MTKKLVLLFMAVPLLFSAGVAAYILLSPPQPYSVSREIVIKRPAQTVFGLLADLRRQSEFNDFNISYPQASFTATQPAAGRNQVAEWSIEQLRVTAEVDRLIKNREIHLNLNIQYGVAFPLRLGCSIAEEARAVSRLTCRLEGALRFHERHLMPAFVAGPNQADPFADTLLNLKLLLEK